jgi:Tfp pilus assembly protein PilN
VRPVNLIPPDQRKGAARAAGADSSPVGVYVFFGVLGVAFLCLLALVLTSNQINSKTEEVSKVQAQEQGAKQVADALRPYGTFAQVQQARKVEISTLASTRFNWERSLRQLSRAIPEDVWLLNLSGTLTPEIEVDDSGGGGDVATLRQKVHAPAFAITGCTYSQHAVARMMTRMQNLDDVTDVELSKSARKDEQDSGAGPGPGVASATGQSATEDAQDCIGGRNITKFDLLVVFGAAPGATTDTSAPVDPASATSTAQAVASAQGAAATAQGASAAAGAATPGTTPAGGTP